MKKLLKVLIFIGVAILIFCCSTAVSNRVLTHQLAKMTCTERIDIFIPPGIADEYRNPMAMTFDDARVWKYSLNEKEISLIEKELEGGKWSPFTSDRHNMFFTHTETEIPDGELYAYTPSDKPSLLFVFDSVNNNYYCFSVSI